MAFLRVLYSPNPLRVHPFSVRREIRADVSPSTCRCLEDTSARVNKILACKIDILVKEKKGFLNYMYIYIYFGSLYPYYFPRVIIVYVCMYTTSSRYGMLFFDLRGCLRRKGVCDIPCIYKSASAFSNIYTADVF